jgi:transcriptional regulator with XRE-family HTH domain
MNLKLHLLKIGMRQNRLAQIVGIDEATLSKIINGFRKPSAEVRKRVGVALHRDENWLFRQAAALAPPDC